MPQLFFFLMNADSTFLSSSIPIDYNLYRKFWTLQDYFRNPVQCYEKFSWMTFLKVRRLVECFLLVPSLCLIMKKHVHSRPDHDSSLK